MSNFTDKELEYIQSQQLGRLAVVNEAGEPHVVPVGFRYNPELDTIDIGGHNMGQSKKFRDVARNSHVAFVIDDVLPPWQPRGVEIRGLGEALPNGGESLGSGELIRITPNRIIGWGIDTHPYTRNSRSIK